MYIVQSIYAGYLLFWYLPTNITSDKPDECSPTDENNKFLNGLIDKCEDIVITDESKKYLKWFFYTLGGLKVFIDLIILYLLTFKREVKKINPNYHTS
tara:strand:+ start:9892 stop:10185 length:294 start_codon:yes stop_codon:yes gene_type:complete